MTDTAIPSIRIDKWLWAARFFKTRSAAATAVAGGHVHVDSQRVKPARQIRVGQTLHITRGEIEFCVLVEGLAEKRGPAPVAQALYRETEASITRRQAAAEARRVQRELRAVPAGRPGKRERRQLTDMKRSDVP
jgi:ribosome-associated heat shock protein Hsp15